MGVGSLQTETAIDWSDLTPPPPAVLADQEETSGFAFQLGEALEWWGSVQHALRLMWTNWKKNISSDDEIV